MEPRLTRCLALADADDAERRIKKLLGLIWAIIERKGR